MRRRSWVAVCVGLLFVITGTAAFAHMTYIHAGWPFTADSGIPRARAVSRLFAMILYWLVILVGCAVILRQRGAIPLLAGVLAIMGCLFTYPIFLTLAALAGL